jgi:hypothetical protein
MGLRSIAMKPAAATRFPLVCTALAAGLLAGASRAQAQGVCGLRNHVRLNHNVCNTIGDSSTHLDSGNVGVGPNLTSGGAIRENLCGGYAEIATQISSDFGNLSYIVDATGTSGSCCGIFLWADEFIGDMPKALWYDTLFPTSSTLPNGTTVTIRATLHVQGGITVANPGETTAWFVASIGRSANYQVIASRVNQQGTVQADFTMTLGGFEYIGGRIMSTIRDQALQGFNRSGGFDANIQAYATFQAITPGVTLNWCSGRNYSGPICDGIDFNSDGSSFDPQDIDAFLSVFSEGPCVPAAADCNDIDFNNDGSVFDPCDIDSFLLVFSEGPCTACGV